MSNFRQPGPGSVLARTFGVTFHSPARLTWPAPGWDQLIHATQGSLIVHTSEGAWVAAAERALWVPSGVEPSIDVRGPAAMRIVYFPARTARALPRHCTAVNIAPLLRELIVRTVNLGALVREVPEQRRLAAVLLDELRSLPDVPLQLPVPRDPRGVRAAGLLQADPTGGMSARLAREAGASLRTLERIFRAETGVALGAWIRRARLLHAVRQLAAGESVTAVAAACGYESTSAFVSMFRRELGASPGRYMEPKKIPRGAGAGRDPRGMVVANARA